MTYRRCPDQFISYTFLIALGDDTLVYPGHDYNGMTMTAVGEERRFNPRLVGKNVEDFVRIMDNLTLPNPKLIDVAVPTNLQLGLNS
jgi:sulfur dioxygenase